MSGIFIRERGGRLGYRDRGDTRRQEGHVTMEAEIGVMHAATKPRRATELQGLLGASRG